MANTIEDLTAPAPLKVGDMIFVRVMLPNRRNLRAPSEPGHAAVKILEIHENHILVEFPEPVGRQEIPRQKYRRVLDVVMDPTTGPVKGAQGRC